MQCSTSGHFPYARSECIQMRLNSAHIKGSISSAPTTTLDHSHTCNLRAPRSAPMTEAVLLHPLLLSYQPFLQSHWYYASICSPNSKLPHKLPETGALISCSFSQDDEVGTAGIRHALPTLSTSSLMPLVAVMIYKSFYFQSNKKIYNSRCAGVHRELVTQR